MNVDAQPHETAIPEPLLTEARALFHRYREHFWSWCPGASIDSWNDARLVVEHLRAHGDSEAWALAQQLWKQLLACR